MVHTFVLALADFDRLLDPSGLAVRVDSFSVLRKVSDDTETSTLN